MNEQLSIALPKGRLGKKAYEMLARCGLACPAVLEDSRKLIFENELANVRYFWAKPSDVAIYVERGAADVGVVGLDIILEQQPDIFELFDLDLGRCKIAVAGKRGASIGRGKVLRVATKFPNVAQRHFSAQSREIEIIKLNGSIELAPIVDLSDVIVDIVETGKTLKENELEVIETICEISARLVVNKAAFRFKTKRIEELIEKMRIDVSEVNRGIMYDKDN